MKKLMTVALAAVLAMAMTAVAISQTVGHTMTAKVSPFDSGTKKKPKSAKTTLEIETPINQENTVVDTFTFQFPSTLRVSTKGFKRCHEDDIAAAGNSVPVKCKAARVGEGEAAANVFGSPKTLEVQLFARDSSSLLVFVHEDTLNLNQAFKADIRKGTDGFAQDLVSDVPSNLEYPVGGGPGSGQGVNLQSVELVLGKSIKNNKYRIVSSIGCKSKRHKLGSILEYSEPVGAQDTSTSVKVKCKK